MIDAKTQLAKLLATEDITVRHSQTAKTASFDVDQRVLTLPNWITKYSDILDMMTGHEVGHAIWTKKEDWERALKELKLHQGITNIVEDARIEKKIKRKYPGLVKSFHTGYKALERKNFFYKSVEELEDFNLLDRINLHCKMGALRSIEFNDMELPYVEMVEAVETWADTERVTLILMDLMKSEAGKQQTALNWEDSDSGTGDPFDSDFDQDDMDKGGSGQSGLDGNMEDILDSDGGLLSDIVQSQENFDRNVADRLTESDARRNEVRYFTLPDPNMKNILIPYKRVISELDVIVNGLDKDYLEAQGDPRRRVDRMNAADHGCVGESACSIDYIKFRRDAVKIVGYMAKEFERKKSAREYRKESISKTGVLDMSKVFSYKYNDDLFLRNTLRPDGKNHGVMMLVDWSASMSHHIHDTIKQVMSLVWFCQKVNIPFEVYAFSTAYPSVWDQFRKDDRENGVKFDDWKDKIDDNDWQTWNIKGNNVNFGNHKGLDNFRLLQMFSSKMNAKDVTKMMKLMFRYGWGHEYRFEKWGNYDLGSTPTLPALVAMNKVIPAFRKHYKLDICNLIVLTDGEGNNSFGSINDIEGYEGNVSDNVDCRLEDPVTKKQYRLKDYGHRNSKYIEKTLLQERAVLALLKDRYNVNIIGLYLDGHSNGKTVRQSTLEMFLGWRYYNKEKFIKVRKELRQNGMASLPWTCYDEFYIVPVGKLRDTSGDLDIDGTMTVGKIKNAFKKNQNAKFGNKILVNRMMDVMA